MAKSTKPQAAPAGKQPPRRAPVASNAPQTKKQIAHGKRETRQNRIIFLSVAGLAVLALVILGYGLVTQVIMKPGTAVALVNGAKLRRADYDALLQYRRTNLNSNIQQMEAGIQELDPEDQNNQFLISFYQQQVDQLKAELVKVDQTVLDEMIEDALIAAKAKETGLSVAASEVQKQIDDDLQQIVASPTEAVTDTQTVPTATPVPQKELDRVYESALTSMGLTDKQFRAILQRSLLRTKVQDLLSGEVPTTGLVADVQLIVTDTQETADAALGRIQNGEDFAAVAKEVSSDAQVQDNGGAVGWLAQGQAARRYGQALEDWIFAQEPGGIAVVESDGKFYVVKVVAKDENGPLPADELSYRQTNALTDWLTQRQASPEVKIERLLGDAPSTATPSP
jgi:hypothetical protein